jgi:hypothetical protein
MGIVLSCPTRRNEIVVIQNSNQTRGYLPAQQKKEVLRPYHNHRNVQLPPLCAESVVHFLISIPFDAKFGAQSSLTLLDKLFQLAAHVADRLVRNTILLCLSLSVALGLRAHELGAGTQTATMPIAGLRSGDGRANVRNRSSAVRPSCESCRATDLRYERGLTACRGR